jgi:predicted enzyme related to lactoylglutathione lyase
LGYDPERTLYRGMRVTGFKWLMALLLTGPLALAQAGVSLFAARMGGPDVAALAQFYQSAFGLKEVNRITPRPGVLEIMLNFGDSVADAKASHEPQVVIMHREGELTDPIPHLILTVTDIAATAKAVKAAGGTMQREPAAFGNTGMVIGFAKDPAGNLIELIQQH